MQTTAQDVDRAMLRYTDRNMTHYNNSHFVLFCFIPFFKIIVIIKDQSLDASTLFETGNWGPSRGPLNPGDTRFVFDWTQGSPPSVNLPARQG